LLIAFKSKSQNKFFFSPELNFKTSIAFVDPANMNNNENNFLENQRFYKPYAIAYNARVVKHQFSVYGLSAGFIFKNDSRMLKVCYNKDIAGYRAFSLFRAYNSETHSGSFVNYMGIGYHRILIDFGAKISSRSNLIKTWFTFGAGINVNQNQGAFNSETHWNIDLNPNGDKLLYTYLRSVEENKVNFCLKIGFDHDIFMKNKYIASLNFNYIQGLGIISRAEYGHVYNFNGLVVKDGTELMSRGSGFYWGIKRRFQVYPKKIKVKSS
jgi:hypothetical protein